MRIHLELRDAAGRKLRDASFESVVVTIGGAEHDDFEVPGLRATALQIANEGGRASLHDGGKHRLLGPRTVLQVGSYELVVQLFPRPGDVAPAPGACPCCGGALVQKAVGGAYRSAAREEHRCPECGASVLALSEAAAMVGPVAAGRATEWLHVEVPMRCPTCTATMRRAVLRTAETEVDVERCEPCGLVVLDPGDRERLAAEGSDGGHAE